MKKWILSGLASLFLIAFLFVFINTRPSGDINLYESYFANDTGSTGNGVKVTFFGVSTLLFDDGETQILLDGFFSRPSLWRALLTKIKSDTAEIDQVIATAKMNRVKGIFVTHSHYDHAFDVAYTTKKTGATLFGSSSTLQIARGGDVKEEQLSQYQPYKKITLGKFSVQVIPSIHSAGSALKDENLQIEKPIRQPASMKAYLEGGSFDFYIQHGGHAIYVKPSPNFVENALDTVHADALFLGIATVGKHPFDWQQNYYAQTVGKLKPAILIPVHWDNFFYPVSENLVMLPRFADDTPYDFDFFIDKTKTDHIDFKILQGTKSIVLFNQ